MQFFTLVRGDGFEPPAHGLKTRCSTAELTPNAYVILPNFKIAVLHILSLLAFPIHVKLQTLKASYWPMPHADADTKLP